MFRRHNFYFQKTGMRGKEKGKKKGSLVHGSVPLMWDLGEETHSGLLYGVLAYISMRACFCGLHMLLLVNFDQCIKACLQLKHQNAKVGLPMTRLQLTNVAIQAWMLLHSSSSK